ncbi:MAG: MerR family transcriptional regulator [Vulcanococcus sp.]|jgi:DNA-binding transcriptional MerR regulator
MVDLDRAATDLADQAAPADVASGALSLEELLERAAERLGEVINARTVRLYATEGLIDRPGRDGRRAAYGQRQLLQLVLIRCLARRGLSLAAIAPLVAVDDDALERQLSQLEERSPANPALAYLQELQSAPDLIEMLGAPICSAPPSDEPIRGPRISSRGLSSRSASRWHRLGLAPGVELHLSDNAAIPPAGPRREVWLQRLLDRLRDHLDDLT